MDDVAGLGSCRDVVSDCGNGGCWHFSDVLVDDFIKELLVALGVSGSVSPESDVHSERFFSGWVLEQRNLPSESGGGKGSQEKVNSDGLVTFFDSIEQVGMSETGPSTVRNTVDPFVGE